MLDILKTFCIDFKLIFSIFSVTLMYASVHVYDGLHIYGTKYVRYNIMLFNRTNKEM